MNSGVGTNTETALIPFEPSRLEYEIKSAKESYSNLLTIIKNVIASSDYLKKVFFRTEIDFDTNARQALANAFSKSTNEVEKQAINEVEVMFDDIFTIDKLQPEFGFTFFQINFDSLYLVLNEMDSKSNSEIALKAKYKREIIFDLIKMYFQQSINFLNNCVAHKPLLPQGEVQNVQETIPRKMTRIRKGELASTLIES